MTTVGTWLAAHPDLDRRDREVLLGRAAGLTRGQIVARPERCLTPGLLPTLENWVERRRRGEPVAYILGEKEFWGLSFEVSPAVLVPRPETELLVEVALEALEQFWEQPPPSSHSRAGARSCKGGPIRVLELGTGSGAVAIALAHEAGLRGLPVQITAIDVSDDALSLAARNGRRHSVDIQWLQSDWFSNVQGTFHLMLSNPPYVAEDDPHLDDLGHEPRRALAAGPEGLDAIGAITAAAPGFLEPAGILALEHGHDQGPRVRALMTHAGCVAAQTLADLAGLDRVTRAAMPGEAS